MMRRLSALVALCVSWVLLSEPKPCQSDHFRRH